MSGGRAQRITFGMIVLNGMPFLPYNLRALYPYASEIIVVEGAAPGAKRIAGPDGHSLDGTLDELRRFCAEEDPDGKIALVTAEDEGHADGFWPGEKDQQSRAYASRATGDYLWQVDVDEFYLPEDMERVLWRLARLPEVSAVTFPTVTLWGAPWCRCDGWYLRRGAADFHRLFRWGRGYKYVTHRPPTVFDPSGRDTRDGHWLDARCLERQDIKMLHYSLLFPRQVREKVEYYRNWGLYGDTFAEMDRWLHESYSTLRRPYRVHNVYAEPSWLEPYHGPHPPEVRRMLADIAAGRIVTETRPMQDVEALLESPRYVLGREALRIADSVDRCRQRMRGMAGTAARTLAPGLRRG